MAPTPKSGIAIKSEITCKHLKPLSKYFTSFYRFAQALVFVQAVGDWQLAGNELNDVN